MNDIGSHGRSSIAKAAAFGIGVEAFVGTAEMALDAAEGKLMTEFLKVGLHPLLLQLAQGTPQVIEPTR